MRLYILAPVIIILEHELQIIIIMKRNRCMQKYLNNESNDKYNDLKVYQQHKKRIT